MTTSILQPGQIEAAAGDIVRLYLPSPTLFADRAKRCRQLAIDHPLGGYLAFCAVVAEQQQLEFDQFPLLPLPDAKMLYHCREHDMPPLSPEGWPPHPHWQEVVQRLLKAGMTSLPAQGQQAVQEAPVNDPTWLNAQQTALLQGKVQRVDPAIAPFIGAALQVQWSALASRLSVADLALGEEHRLCPVCGSHPLASVLYATGPSKGLRYLHCALCGCQWHMVRAKCSNCGNGQGIEYFSLNQHLPHVQAEACPDCNSYIKLIRQHGDIPVDPLADDLASLALDLCMDEKNYAKTAVNLLLLHAAIPDRAHR